MEIEDGVATFPNGLQLRLKPRQVNPQTVNVATSRYPDPAVPVKRVTIGGVDTTEENPDDPTYAQAIERAKARRGNAAMEVILVQGTEFIAPPTGELGPDEVEWDVVAYLEGIPVPTNKIDKYKLWVLRYGFVKGYASPHAGAAEYIDLLAYLVGESGMSMEVPATMAAAFRAQTGWSPDPRGDALAPDGNGAVGGRTAGGGLGRGA